MWLSYICSFLPHFPCVLEGRGFANRGCVSCSHNQHLWRWLLVKVIRLYGCNKTLLDWSGVRERQYRLTQWENDLSLCTYKSDNFNRVLDYWHIQTSVSLERGDQKLQLCHSKFSQQRSPSPLKLRLKSVNFDNLLQSDWATGVRAWDPIPTMFLHTRNGVLVYTTTQVEYCTSLQ